LIRTGKKRLFLSDVFGNQHECLPLCVLDFYIHESKQRSGYGRVLFEFMIHKENIAPFQLAIDRPSPKFVNFLKKHYKLENPLNQINKFVIFQSFFSDDKAIGLVDSNRRRSAPVYRNKLLERHTQQASRNVSSANSTSNSRTNLSSALGSLTGVKPVIRADYSRNAKSEQHQQQQQQQQSPLLGMRINNRPVASHAQRRHDTNSAFSGVSSYSRHNSASRKDLSTPLSPLVKNARSSKPPHAVVEPRNLLRDQHHTEMHGRGNSNLNQQITSLDNPFSTPLQNNSVSTGSDTSYTLGLLDNFSKPTSLGTSWNVFGVPGSNVKTSNPYARMGNTSRK